MDSDPAPQAVRCQPSRTAPGHDDEGARCRDERPVTPTSRQAVREGRFRARHRDRSGHRHLRDPRFAFDALHRGGRGHARQRDAATPRREVHLHLPRRRQLGQLRLQARRRHVVHAQRRIPPRTRTARPLARSTVRRGGSRRRIRRGHRRRSAARRGRVRTGREAPAPGAAGRERASPARAGATPGGSARGPAADP